MVLFIIAALWPANSKHAKSIMARKRNELAAQQSTAGTTRAAE
jgi:hypothetical protein